jgi:hypothetical protein
MIPLRNFIDQISPSSSTMLPNYIYNFLTFFYGPKYKGKMHSLRFYNDLYDMLIYDIPMLVIQIYYSTKEKEENCLSGWLNDKSRYLINQQIANEINTFNFYIVAYQITNIILQLYDIVQFHSSSIYQKDFDLL